MSCITLSRPTNYKDNASAQLPPVNLCPWHSSKFTSVLPIY
jgi:hypothetical protein